MFLASAIAKINITRRVAANILNTRIVSTKRRMYEVSFIEKNLESLRRVRIVETIS